MGNCCTAFVNNLFMALIKFQLFRNKDIPPIEQSNDSIDQNFCSANQAIASKNSPASPPGGRTILIAMGECR
jgi:hypothetical protein